MITRFIPFVPEPFEIVYVRGGQRRENWSYLGSAWAGVTASILNLPWAIGLGFLFALRGVLVSILTMVVATRQAFSVSRPPASRPKAIFWWFTGLVITPFEILYCLLSNTVLTPLWWAGEVLVFGLMGRLDSNQR